MIILPKRTRATIDAHINIVPYIDVMLVLLVIFMMTTPIIEQGIEVDLPKQSGGEAKAVNFADQEPAIISINRDGEYFIKSMYDDGIKPLSAKNIAIKVEAIKQVFPTTQVFIRGDREVAYGAVIALMSFLQKHGVGKIGIITESEEE